MAQHTAAGAGPVRRVSIGSTLPRGRRRGSALADERPTIEGSRVRLMGAKRDGPEGVVTGVGAADYSFRWVWFDGELAPVLVPLSLLRRLP